MGLFKEKTCKVCGALTQGSISGESICFHCYVWGWSENSPLTKEQTKRAIREIDKELGIEEL